MAGASTPRTIVLRLRQRPLALAAAALLVLAVVALAVLGRAWRTCGFGECPDVTLLNAYQPGGASLLLDRNGEPFADLAPVERETVPLHELPTRVVQAFLAVEDKRFQAHHGVDWRRVGGALIANLRARSFAQGFSTITMQLARNLFPDEIPGQERSTARKLLEIRVAREIEERFSKDEILELYLNHIYFGNGARGIAAASRHYFRRPPSQLTLPQAALLAALPKAPTHYDPRQHPAAARERRDLVLALMVQQRRVPAKEAEAAQAAPLGVQPPPRRARRAPGLAPYFVEAVRRELEERLGAEIYRRPVRVWTTLDVAAQRAAEEELARQLAAIEEGDLGRFRSRRYAPALAPSADGTSYLQGAVVVLSAADGDVLAWVGGRDFLHSQFDRVANARRQPGSAFKPFVYAAALADGWALSQPLSDDPLTVRLPNGQTWTPKNFYGRYEGRVTVRDALVRSKNVATVRLAREVGADDVAALAVRAGIEPPIPRVPSMPLGTTAVSPLELTAAYTAFAGLGRGVRPRLVRRVETPEGRLLWQPAVEAREVLDPAVAYLVTDVLREALERGSGTAALAAGVRGPAAGKTGTSNDGVDAWFVGYTPQVAAGVWIGFDKPLPIADEASGGRLAAPVWGRLLARLSQGRPAPRPWTAPQGVIERPVDPGTGLLLARGCRPSSGEAYREKFLAGREPQAFCPGRQAVPIAGFFTRERALAEQAEQRQAEQLAAERQRKSEQLAAQRQKELEQLAAQRQKEQEQLAAQRQAQIARQRRDEELARRRAAEQLAAKRAADQRAAGQRQNQPESDEAGKLAQSRQEEQRRAEEARKAAEQERERRTAALAARAAELREREKKIAEAERRARLEDEAERAGRERATTRPEEDEAKRAERERETRPDEDEPERRADEAERRPRTEEDVVEDVEVELEPEPEPERRADADVSGWWELSNRIDSTNYPSYRGLRLGYRLLLEQDGDRVSGQGQKWSENGRRLPAAQRTPITVTGVIEDGELRLRFTERGTRRTSGGSFRWRLTPGGDRLAGSFASSAADTSGSSSAWRIP